MGETATLPRGSTTGIASACLLLMAALTTYHDEAEDRAVFGTPRSIDFEAWAKQIEKQSSHLAAEIGAYVQAARRAGIEDGVVQQQLMLAHVPHFMINDALKGDDDE